MSGAQKAALLMLKGVLSDATPEERAEVEAAAELIKELVTELGDIGVIALTLVGLELADEE